MNTRMKGWQASEERRPLGGAPVLAERVFRPGDAPALRRFTRAFGARAGIGSGRLADFVLAVNEAAASAAGRAPCGARVRLWITGRRAFCQVQGNDMLLRRVRGDGERQLRAQSEPEALRRLLLRRLSDYVSFTSDPEGVTVLLSMTVT